MFQAKKVIVLINGEAGVGKDAFVTYCINEMESQGYVCTNLHRSDFAKSCLHTMFWDGIKTIKVRKLLADMVDFGEETGFNLNWFCNMLSNSHAKVVFYHVRDTEAIESLYKTLKAIDGYAVHTLFVSGTKSNEKEKEDRWGVSDFDYEYFIKNDGTLRDLGKKAKIVSQRWMRELSFI